MEEIEWKNVGDYFRDGTNKHRKTGIQWYNADGIFGTPGGNQSNPERFGWTDTSSSGTGDWAEARHAADEPDR